MKQVLIFSKDDTKSIHVANSIKILLEDQAICCELYTISCQTLKLKNADFMIVVGGDGTFLASIRQANKYFKELPPVLGINQGSLGFLTEASVDEFKDLIISGLKSSFQIDKRTMFKASIDDDNEEIFLNDILVSRRSSGKIFNFEIYYNSEFISSIKADGILISTPTGSTAHSLSAGGPILHPDISAMLITPIAPHTLSNRPIVVSDQGVIDIVVNKDQDDINVVVDGYSIMENKEILKVRVRKNQEYLKLVRPHGKTYFDILRNKLSFGRRN